MTIPFIPSPYQQNFFTWVRDGRGSCILVAVAGAGKSTSIQEALALIPEERSVHVFVFNAPIAKEWKERLARLVEREGRPFRGVRTSTFHSAGFAAVCKRLGKRPQEVETDGRKLQKLVREWLGEAEQELYGDFICKLVGFAKGEGIGALTPDAEDRWYALIQHHDLYLDADEADEVRAVQLARELLRRSNEAAQTGFIDYDDQLYLVILWRLRLWQNDWVFVDEAQDTNPVRRAIAKLALRPGGRLVAVGDPRQAIYGFTGASHDALDLIKREFNCVELPLTVSYRCAQAVVRQAQTIVDHIEAAPTAIEGSVSHLILAEALRVLDNHDVVLCRQTAPLIELAYDLVAKGVGCAVLGRDIGTGLVNLIRKTRARWIDPRNVDADTGLGDGTSLIERLRAYREREVAKFTAKGEEQKAEAVTDRVACVTVVIDHLPENARTIAALVAKIEGMFSDTNGVLMLSTIHKAKGREWRRVGVLRPDLMPSKWARQEHQYLQELNLQYVAYTRAMEELIFITPGGTP